MKPKMAKLSEKTRIELNRVKSILLSENPKLRMVTDDIAVYEALKNYKGGKHGRTTTGATAV